MKNHDLLTIAGLAIGAGLRSPEDAAHSYVPIGFNPSNEVQLSRRRRKKSILSEKDAAERNVRRKASKAARKRARAR